MRRIIVKSKDGKKRLVNVPSWDREVVNNQIGQPAYDISLSSTSGSVVSGSTTQFNIGFDASGSYFKGDVAEMTLFTRTLASYEISNVENYLQTHWGL